MNPTWKRVFVLLVLISIVFTQTHWARKTDAPVLQPTPGGWDNRLVLGPGMLEVDDTLRMWYQGWPGRGIGYAWSLDGINWTKHISNPVLIGPSGAWDSGTCYDPIVVEEDDGTFIMLYTGENENLLSAQIGVAFADHPAGPWTRAGDPVITLADGGEGATFINTSGGLLYLDGEYTLIYSVDYLNSISRIGQAHSASLTEGWLFDRTDPISEPGPEGCFEGNIENGVDIVQAGNELCLFYVSSQFEVGLALRDVTSTEFTYEHCVWNPLQSWGSTTGWDGGGWVPEAIMYDAESTIFRNWYIAYDYTTPESDDAALGYATSIQGYRGLTIDTESLYFDPADENVGVTLTYTGEAPGIGFTVEVLHETTNTVSTHEFFDDGLHNDGESGDGVFGASVSVPAFEGYYYLSVDDDWEFSDASLSYKETEFTTLGPLAVASIEHLYPPQGAIPPNTAIYFDLLLENLGQVETAEDIIVTIHPADTNTTLVGGATSSTFDDIPAGETQMSVSNLAMRTHPDLEDSTPILFDVEISRGGVVYWKDSGVLLGVVGIEERETDIPTSYRLVQNYPNPFNPTTTIQYSLPESGPVKLTIFDILGQEVHLLQEAEIPRGIYQVQWDGMNDSGEPVKTGVYFCRLEAAGFCKTIKMVYLK